MSVQTVPILPSRDLDDVLPFYLALGFRQTYRQARPNPYLCVSRGDGFDLHFFGLPEHDAQNSLFSVVVSVPDTQALYDEFAAGLRSAYGRLPIAGLPRITRPRRKQGAGAGFSVVDPAGNWLRISSGAEETETGDRFERALLNAARQADARGDEAAGIKVLEAALRRHPDATDQERIPVLIYLAELLIRTGGPAAAVLDELAALDTSDFADQIADLTEQLND
ncbi:VOC family protein [Kribbella sp. CA-253562]|uniref:VOC family protein n=1 Tax=Kribbella sp. CA-253562 TaxID=3239942 RepID=UPI003D934043